MGTPADPWIAADHPWITLIVWTIFVAGFVYYVTKWASKG